MEGYQLAQLTLKDFLMQALGGRGSPCKMEGYQVTQLTLKYFLMQALGRGLSITLIA